MGRTDTVDPSAAKRRGALALLRSLSDHAVDIGHNTLRMAAAEARVLLHRLTARVTLPAVCLQVAAWGLLLARFGAAMLLAHVTGMDDLTAS